MSAAATEKLQDGQKYYTPGIFNPKMPIDCVTWRGFGDNVDLHLLKTGQIFLTLEDCRQSIINS